MRNFGNINNAFSEVLVESFTKKDTGKKNLFNTYLKTIKESKILKTQYMIYKNISSKSETNDLKVQEYVKENINLMSKFSTKDIKKANDDLLKLIGEGSKLLELDYEVKELHENINNFLTLSRSKNANNISELVESYSYIVDYIKSNEPKDTEPLVSEAVGRLAVDKFNEKYSDISEDERSIIKTIIESDTSGKEVAFKNVVVECIDLIDDQLKESDIETKDKLLKVKDKLLRMSYNKDNFIVDVKKVIELKRDLN